MKYFGAVENAILLALWVMRGPPAVGYLNSSPLVFVSPFCYKIQWPLVDPLLLRLLCTIMDPHLSIMAHKNAFNRLSWTKTASINGFLAIYLGQRCCFLQALKVPLWTCSCCVQVSFQFFLFLLTFWVVFESFASKTTKLEFRQFDVNNKDCLKI